jgi:hypothetical protein
MRHVLRLEISTNKLDAVVGTVFMVREAHPTGWMFLKE